MYLVALMDAGKTLNIRIRDMHSELGEYRVRGEIERKAGSHDDPLSLGVYEAESLEIAREFGKYAIRQRPQVTVYISEVVNQVVAETPKPMFKKVNAQGVMPE